MDETADMVRSRSGVGLKEVVGELCMDMARVWGECGSEDTEVVRAAVGETVRVGSV